MDHVTVSQSDRLGDTILNKDSKTHRHNLVNKAVYDAVSAQATASVILGDKGDGAKRDRAEALERYAHYNLQWWWRMYTLQWWWRMYTRRW